ncbi:unnamed protein product [Ophioblennius macclurei]
MKLCLIIALLTLLTLSAAEFKIQCYGEDFYMVTNNMLVDCSSKERQACYTKVNGEKGCVRQTMCSQPGWRCCNTDRCNA